MSRCEDRAFGHAARAADKPMTIGEIRLVRKTGGRGGLRRRVEPSSPGRAPEAPLH
jgi:hypothetical protein